MARQEWTESWLRRAFISSTAASHKPAITAEVLDGFFGAPEPVPMLGSVVGSKKDPLWNLFFRLSGSCLETQKALPVNFHILSCHGRVIVKNNTSNTKISRRSFVGAALTASLAPQANAQCAPVDLGIRNILQEMSNWCWVAAAQQVIFWANGSAPQQCALVSIVANAHPQHVCAQPHAFNQPASFQPIALVIQRFVGAYASMSGPGSPQQVYQTISSGRAVIMLVYPNFSQLGHFVVLRGVSCYGPDLVFHLNDPLDFRGFQTTNVPYRQIAQMWHSALVVG